VPGAVRLEGGQLAVQVAAVLHLGVGHMDDAPNSLVSGVKADEHRDQFSHIQVVGLGPPGPPVHLNAGGVHHVVLHAVSGQVAVEPEAIRSGLIAAEDIQQAFEAFQEPQGVCNYLAEAVHIRGAPDDLTALVVAIEPAAQVRRGHSNCQDLRSWERGERARHFQKCLARSEVAQLRNS